ncbi:hypothetical protein HYPSUDRAFT_208094 [Hypholoma sublateritium FD-334 SS-4]|uniref:G-protein coupled receptors family 1 profile domain-containing protein n=1 Tax=Hypholoma sublateritium (strain FD-334 SS-4) TaxID=945553 RepID=A0A0D2N7W7_HYPSF|nr:hypothetical protein HYPSUDRAFT_208094 [Hypholoma sublateritium FD-334 SS-4]
MSANASVLDPSTWGPVGEDSLAILNDELNLIGSTVLCGVAYGAILPLYFICAYELFLQLRKSERVRQSIINLVCITLLLVLSTLYVASNAYTTQLAYVNDRNYPGGPAVYSSVIFYLPVSIMGLCSFFAINWITDIVLIWRLYTVYGGQRLAKIVIVVPSIMFLGSLAMSLVVIDESVHVGESFWSNTAVKFVLGYYSLTVSLTIISTGLLLTRLLMIKRRTVRALGHSGSAGQYLSVEAIIIESSAAYTVWGIIFIGLYSVNSPYQDIFLSTISAVQVIALLMILLRVNRGTAWRQDTAGEVTSAIELTRRSVANGAATSNTHIESEANSTYKV